MMYALLLHFQPLKPVFIEPSKPDIFGAGSCPGYPRLRIRGNPGFHAYWIYTQSVVRK